MGRAFASVCARTRILDHLHTATSQSEPSLQFPRTRLDEHLHLEIPSRSSRECILGRALVHLAAASRPAAVPLLPCWKLVHHVGRTASTAILRPALWKVASGNSNRFALCSQLSSVGHNAPILPILLLLLPVRGVSGCCYCARLASIAGACLWRACRHTQCAARSGCLRLLLPPHGPPAAAVRLRIRLLAVIQNTQSTGKEGRRIR